MPYFTFSFLFFLLFFSRGKIFFHYVLCLHRIGGGQGKVSEVPLMTSLHYSGADIFFFHFFLKMCAMDEGDRILIRDQNLSAISDFRCLRCFFLEAAF